MNKYEEPIIEVIEFGIENIILTSFTGGDFGDGDVIIFPTTDLE